MKDYICKCGAVNEVVLRPKGTAIGLYCRKCGKWQKWVTKEEAAVIKNRFSTKSAIELPDELVINGIVYMRKQETTNE